MPKEKKSEIYWVELPPPPKQFNFLKRKRDGTLVAKRLQKTPCWFPSKNASFVTLVPEEGKIQGKAPGKQQTTDTVKSVRNLRGQNKVDQPSKTDAKIQLRKTRRFGSDMTIPTTPSPLPPSTRRRRSQPAGLSPPSPSERPHQSSTYDTSTLSGLIAALAGPITYGDNDAYDVAVARCDPCGGSGRDADSEPAFDFAKFLKDRKIGDWEEVEREKSASIVEAVAAVQAAETIQAETAVAEAEVEAEVKEEEPGAGARAEAVAGTGTEVETEDDSGPEIQPWEMYMGGDATDGGCGDVAVSLSVLEEIWETSQMDNRSRRTDDEEREMFLLHALTSDLEGRSLLLEGFLLDKEGQNVEVLELSDGSLSAWESVSAERSEIGSLSVVGVEGEDWTAAVEWQDAVFPPETFSSEELEESVGEKGGCDEVERADEGGTELQFDHSTSEHKLSETLSPAKLAGTSASNDPDIDYRVNSIHNNTLELAPEVAAVELPVVIQQALPATTPSPPLPNPATAPVADPFPIPPAPTPIQIAQIVKNLFSLPSPRRRNIPPPQITWSSPCWQMLALTALVADGALLDDEATDATVDLSVARKHSNEAFLLPAPKESGILVKQGMEEAGTVITADESPGRSVVNLGGELVSERFVAEEDWWGFDVGAGSAGVSSIDGEG
ncbi:hypothetical protein BC937DRAFT_91392 [Endogone sp. FLAS-F59071]|nr:hypothetical protein BC937DRAFT_91392 [Endogone sp. FLAS-F59071]|eukprot:RUS16293.1 hypothetical protein BC937DRAFT_91392 [Endogone sp. FLAS-F59071]